MHAVSVASYGSLKSDSQSRKRTRKDERGRSRKLQPSSVRNGCSILSSEKKAAGRFPAVRAESSVEDRPAWSAAGLAEIHLEVAQIDLRVAFAFLDGFS